MLHPPHLSFTFNKLTYLMRYTYLLIIFALVLLWVVQGTAAGVWSWWPRVPQIFQEENLCLQGTIPPSPGARRTTPATPQGADLTHTGQWGNCWRAL